MSDMAVEINPRRLTVAEYRRMGEVGILDANERLELVDGAIVHMSPVGRPHRARHAYLVEYLIGVLGDRARVAGQYSLALGNDNEPQPDVLILPTSLDLDLRDPEPHDVYAVIELSDASLRFDTGFKRELYARFAIAEYLVVDLNGGVVIRHTQPSHGAFGAIERLGRGDAFRLLAVPDIELDVDRFLPPPGRSLLEQHR